jgi:hypothetical protein
MNRDISIQSLFVQLIQRRLIPNQETITALVAAARGGHTTVVSMLIDAGADVNLPAFTVRHTSFARNIHKCIIKTDYIKVFMDGYDAQLESLYSFKISLY